MLTTREYCHLCRKLVRNRSLKTEAGDFMKRIRRRQNSMIKPAFLDQPVTLGLVIFMPMKFVGCKKFTLIARQKC